MTGNAVTVKLKGDSSDLDRALEGSKNTVTDYGKYVKGAIVAIGAALAAQKIFSFASDSLEAYQEAEQAEMRLQRILKNRGDAIGLNIDQMKQMADNFQRLNAIEADAVVSAQAVVATFQNINGEQFEATLQAAADVAAQTGDDFESASKKIAQSLNDPMKGIRSLRELGITFTESQQDQIQALQETGHYVEAQTIMLEALAEVYGGSAKEKAGEFESQQAQLGFIIGDMQEVLGGLVQDLLSLFIPTAIEVATVFKNILSAISESTGGFEEYRDGVDNYLIKTFEWVVDVAVEAFSYLEFAWKNYSTMVERLVYQDMLIVTKSFENLKYWFTVAIPGYLNWFAENWYDIFKSMYDFQTTIYKNMGKNAIEFFTTLMDWLQGKGGSFEFVALTEGFESSIKELPKIAARELTDFEKMLQQNIDEYDKQLAGNLINIQKKNRDSINGLFDKPQEVKIEPKIKEQVITEKVKKDAKSAKDEAEKTLSDTKSKESDKESAAGQKTDITALADQIQQAALKAKQEAREAANELPKLTEDELQKQQMFMDKIAYLRKQIKLESTSDAKDVKLQAELERTLNAAMPGRETAVAIQRKQRELRTAPQEERGARLAELQNLMRQAQGTVEQVASTEVANKTVSTKKAEAAVAPAATPSITFNSSALQALLQDMLKLQEKYFPRIESAATNAGALV